MLSMRHDALFGQGSVAKSGAVIDCRPDCTQPVPHLLDSRMEPRQASAVWGTVQGRKTGFSDADVEVDARGQRVWVQ